MATNVTLTLNGASTDVTLSTGGRGATGATGAPGTTDYNELDNVPSEFPPEAHTHPVSDITPISSGKLVGRHGGGSGAGQEVTVGNGLEFSGSGIGIANDAVTNAKLANVPTATIKGRITAGTGDPEDLTPAQAIEVIGAATPASVEAQIEANRAVTEILTGEKTFTAPIVLTGTPSANTHVLNRNQIDGSAADWSFDSVSFNTPAGTATGSVAVSGSQFTMAVASGSTVGQTKYASSFVDPFFDIGSLTSQIAGQHFSAYFNLNTHTQMDECPLTLLFGVGSAVTSIASVAGLAVKFTKNTAKLQIHNGNTLQESSAFAISNFDFSNNTRVFVNWNATTLRLYIKQWGGGGIVSEPRWTLVGSLTHSEVLPTVWSGSSLVVARTVESTTTATATLRFRSCQTINIALTPNL